MLTNDECLLDETLDAGKILADLSDEDLGQPPDFAPEIVMAPQVKKQSKKRCEKENARFTTRSGESAKIRSSKSPGSML